MPRAKKAEAKESAQEEGLPKWAEDEIKAAKFGQPEVISRTGYILEIYEKEGRLDIQVYEPMPDGRIIVEGITMPKSTKVNDLMKGFVYEFKINFYSAPSLIGGEVVRVAWMAKMGVPAGKATWVTIMEIIADVFAVTILAFIAGALAIAAGATSVGVTIIAVAAATFGFWLAIVLLSAKRVLKIPAFAERLVRRFAKKKG